MNLTPPVFITSRKRVKEQHDLISGLGCEVIYSYKTNKTVWKVLEQDTRCGVSCHSVPAAEEINSKDRVWYFPLADSELDYEKLLQSGIRKYVVDSRDDLEVLLKAAESMEKKIWILVRVKMKENTIFTGRHYVFGMDWDEGKGILEELSTNPLVERTGIHFHRKTQNVSEWRLKDDLQEILSDDIMKMISIVNIGGGMPANYKSIHDKAIESIFNKIRELREWLPDDIDIYAEPGRFIAAPSTILKARIIAIRGKTIFVNFSIFNGAIDTVIANVKLLVENELPEGEGGKYLIKGATPDSADILRYDVWLDNPRIGDELVFLSAGAYNFTTEFCNLPRPEEKIVDEF